MPSHFLSSQCHLRFLASFGFPNKHLILTMIGRYHTTFIGGSMFLLNQVVFNVLKNPNPLKDDEASVLLDVVVLVLALFWGSSML